MNLYRLLTQENTFAAYFTAGNGLVTVWLIMFEMTRPTQNDTFYNCCLLAYL